MKSDPKAQLETMIANLPGKTGKPLEAWIELIRAQSLEGHKDIMSFLKGEHGISHGFANLISAKARESSAPEDPVVAQYAGAKAGLRPIHDAIIDYARSLGADVEIAPKKASVSLRRTKQFALITPATRTRVDLGLALKGEPEGGRLARYNAMCSHRIQLDSIAAFDAFAKDAMARAYANAK